MTTYDDVWRRITTYNDVQLHAAHLPLPLVDLSQHRVGAIKVGVESQRGLEHRLSLVQLPGRRQTVPFRDEAAHELDLLLVHDEATRGGGEGGGGGGGEDEDEDEDEDEGSAALRGNATP